MISDLAAEIEALRPIADLAPTTDFRLHERGIPRQALRRSGRTAEHAGHSVVEPPVSRDTETPLTFSMEGSTVQPPAPLIPRYWAPGWNSCQSVNTYQAEIGGALRGGDADVRVIRGGEKRDFRYFTAAPSPFERRGNEWLMIPSYHIFGSDELSALTPGIAELIPTPYVALNSEEAERTGVKEGEPLTLTVAGQTLQLPVIIRPYLPDGLAALPVGLPGLSGLILPAWARIPAAAPADKEAQ